MQTEENRARLRGKQSCQIACELQLLGFIKQVEKQGCVDGGDMSLEGCEGSQSVERWMLGPWIFVERFTSTYDRWVKCISRYKGYRKCLWSGFEEVVTVIPES
jgi:hypothetical protein